MIHYSYSCTRRTVATLLIVACMSLTTTVVQASKKPHDALRKAVRTENSRTPRGTFGAGIPVPRVMSASSAISNLNVGDTDGTINFNLSPDGTSLQKASVPQRIAPVAPLRACVTYDVDNKAYGMVNVTADGLQVIREHEGLQAAWGGTVVGSRYYYNTCADVVSGYIQDVETYLWDMQDNWRCIGYDQMPSLNVIAYSMTCHPVTEIVYGCFLSEDLQDIEIGTLDPMTMKRTGVISKVNVPLYAMGFSSNGTLYGIDATGILYTVSLTDGSYTKVAETGLSTRYNTTGTIDSFTDVFYYAPCPDGPSDNPTKDWALYSIDLRNNYKVEKCWDMNAELGGMFIANEAAKPAAPAAPVIGSLNFTDNSLTGTLSFTAPSKKFDGSDLTGSLNYGIICNGSVFKTGTTTAGTLETVNLTMPSAGMYNFKVYVSNSVGDSPKSESISRWLGNGQPQSPSDMKAVYSLDASEITVTWSPVTSVLSNGYFDPSKVTYTLSRSINGSDPEVIADKIDATSFVDKAANPDACDVYRYTLVCNHSEQVSAPSYSEYLPVGTIKPPFEPDFTSELSQGYFTTKDYLNRGHKWGYSSYDGAMQLIWNYPYGAISMDVALLTAPVELKAGHAYEISYNIWAESRYDHGVGLQWGTDVDNLTTIIEPESVNASNSSYSAPIHQSIVVFPEQDGIYYFSVRALTNAASSVKLLANDFTISQGLSNKAPGEVTDVTFIPPYDGSKKLDISFKAPTTTIEGKKLTDLSKIEVTRGGNLVKVFRNPTFGQTLSFTDTGSKNEDVSYVITSFNTEGQGRSYYGLSHMGVNMPVKPLDCEITQDMSNPGMVTVSWTPVAKDISGNEFDPSLLRYAIFASDYETIKATNVSASTAKATFRAIEPNSGQTFVWYCVVPYTEGGVNGYDGGFGKTPMIPVGTPFEMPYLESFSENTLHYPMGQIGESVRIGAGVSSQHLSIGAQDGDNGNIALYTAPGKYVDLFSANINVADNDDVAMSFYYTGVPDMEGYRIEPYVLCDGIREPLCEPIDTKYCGEKGWNRVQVSLSEWKGKTIQFGLYIYCNDNNFAFGLDNIVLKRYAANDLRAGNVSGPSYLTIGKNHDIVVEVVNDGSDDAPAGYQVDLYSDGELLQTVDGPAVKAFGTVAAKFNLLPDPFAEEEIPFNAVIRWDDDEIMSNNTSEEISIPLVASSYPGVNDLIAKLGDDEKSADLSWSEPDHEAKLHEITESFETYDPFTIAGFGDWSVFDGDGQETWGGNYPNAKTPKAWMVIDQTAMRLYYDGARTGNKSAMASSVSGEADDWLISPELPGIAQKVTLFAATAPEDYGEESFEFYYSTGGTDVSDFIQLGDRIDVPEGEWVEDEYGDEEQVTTWYEYSFDLPEGAKYFAIRYVSDDIWAMFIDDITFTVSDEILTLQGYNLFRNGKMVNGELITTTTHKDDLSEQTPGDYKYAVETVYDKGHSGVSNIEAVTLPEPVSVDGVDYDGVAVFSEKGLINVVGAEGMEVDVFTASGISIHSSVASASLRLAVEPGVYMVKVGNDIFKVIVP